MDNNTLGIYRSVIIFARLSNNNFCIRSNNCTRKISLYEHSICSIIINHDTLRSRHHIIRHNHTIPLKIIPYMKNDITFRRNIQL